MPRGEASAPRTGRPRGLSVRVKLTLSYAGFLVVAGAALFAVGFLLLRFVPEGNVYVVGGGWAPNRTNLVEVFVRYAWWALAGLAAFGLVGGWLLAGRMLRPLDRVTDAARRARDGSLDHRIDLPGARDELTELADAFDAMLGRVQQTLDEERRFAANASHELRTPHAIIRTMVEVARADPDGRDVHEVLRRIGDTNDRAIATTEALLALARAGRGGTWTREAVDLASIVAGAVEEETADAAAADIRIDTSLTPATALGDRTLLGRLAANLVRNAVVHNEPGGWVSVTTGRTARSAELIVANTGPVLDPAVADTLVEPFVRGAGRARGAETERGAGLGLAIVAAVVRAHDGVLDITARPGGGLHVRVELPRSMPRRD
ncbi:HAMP domain-containing histidine kinase [Microbacterium sp. CFH 31415]|uniref:sensor histidine kinase n=1 Tax=Microbacterium sp. CFH 31415 TaxID=2921732 RepID=UPI001F148278|nr:HAMP domain-containing sensor histidine kinase [Microbacterium sp. CFH 31415]MCH6229958.1 HAMP domain-containing histidine kinase [Microbacterium sp. CFH 31415]